MKARRVVGLLIVICGMLDEACTRLEVYKVDSNMQFWQTSGAIPYILPKKTFLISATYVLTACDKADVNNPPDDQKNPPPKLAATINVVPVIEADDDERYYIDSSRLRTWFKETNVVIESYSNQTLRTFNGTLNDQTGPIITATIGAVIKIAALAVMLEVPEQPLPTNVVEICEKKTLDALEEVAKARDELAKVVKNRTMSQPSGDDGRIAELQKRINQLVAEKLTTKKHMLKWSPTILELKKWGTDGGRDAATMRLAATDEMIDSWLSDQGRSWLTLHAEFRPTSIVIEVPSWSHPVSPQPSNRVSDGLVIRNAALGTLWVCEDECPTPQAVSVPVNNVLSATSVAVPQFGPKLLLPLHNGLFQSSVLDVSMSEDGVITKVGVRSTPSAATGIKELGTDAEAAKSAIDARNKAQADALTKAENKARDENKAVADCLEAQKTIIKDGGIPVGTCQ